MDKSFLLVMVAAVTVVSTAMMWVMKKSIQPPTTAGKKGLTIILCFVVAQSVIIAALVLLSVEHVVQPRLLGVLGLANLFGGSLIMWAALKRAPISDRHVTQEQGVSGGHSVVKDFRKVANPIILHSALAPDAVADTLLRSVDKDVVGLRSVLPWFVRLVWKGDSRDVRGLIEGNTFRLRRWNAMRWSPNFYGRWETDSGGTRIEGYFDLAPTVRWSLRLWLATVVGLAILGIVLNSLDLTAGTHFTVDPQAGLGICIFLILLTGAIFVAANKFGSRQDKRLLGFLEQTLAASRVF